MEIKYQSLRGLATILERVKKECKLPVVKALHLKKLIREIVEEIKLYNEQYLEIIDRYAKKDEKGERIVDRSTGQESISLTDPQAFSSEMKELLEQGFEVDSRYADLTVDDLGSMQMTVEEVEFLEAILPIEDELEPQEKSISAAQQEIRDVAEQQRNKVRAFPEVIPPTEVVK